MVICIRCNKEITTIKNIKKIMKIKNGINQCICKQCSNKTTNEDIIYTKYKPCERCGKTNVEVLPFITDEEDMMCEWCRLALKAGIDDIKLFSEKEKQNNMYDDELETLYWMEDMEDWGAFSDEGIMPGCHSTLIDSSMEQYSKRIKEIGLLIKAVREKIGLSIAELAKAVDIPEYIEQNIENGEVYSLGSNCVETKKWWENCDDYEIREEVWKYLYINCIP